MASVHINHGLTFCIFQRERKEYPIMNYCEDFVGIPFCEKEDAFP
jgi:hypothetical protein